MSGPLAGIRVLDLSRVLAGPWCAQNLGDLGADIIKVERPHHGDDSRHWGPPWLKDGDGNDTEESAYYISTNRNKRSVAIDMAKLEGQDLIRDLAKSSDICIENFKTGDLSRYALDWKSLREVNPGLIYCSITGFGQAGPFASQPGYDYLFQGLSGLMSVTGERDGAPGAGPQRTGAPVVDLFTGMYATVSILAALHHRNLTGFGQQIDISLLDTSLALNAGQISSYLLTGVSPQRTGNRSPSVGIPYAAFPCSDGDIIVAAGNQSQFIALCEVMDRQDLSTDQKYSSNNLRLKHGEELFNELAKTFRSRNRRDWESALRKANVPSGSINDFAGAISHPQAQFHGAQIAIDHYRGGEAPGIASPMRFSDTVVDYRYAPPVLGQHTTEVLSRDLGISLERIAELEASNTVECAEHRAFVKDQERADPSLASVR